MQFLRGGRRWLLKSPQHLEQVPVLDRVFPDSIVVFTHRDPVPVALSMIAMITYSARMHRSPVPVERIARSWIDRLEQMLNALVRDRDTIGPDRSIDIRFDDFMANELGVAERVYALGRRTVHRPGAHRGRRLPGGPPARPTRKRRDVVRDVRAEEDDPARALRAVCRAVPELARSTTFSIMVTMPALGRPVVEHRYVDLGDGVTIHVADAGPPTGRPSCWCTASRRTGGSGTN